MVKPRIEDETREEKFKRIAGSRVNRILDQMATLRNCANTQVYSYDDAQVSAIFRALESELKLTKSAFKTKITERRRGFKL